MIKNLKFTLRRAQGDAEQSRSIKMKNEKLTKEGVIHVAELAGLTLTPPEVEKFQKQLSAVLNYINQLNKLKTEKVEPTSQVTDLKNVFKEDKTQPSLSQEEALSGAREKYNNLFKVKAILEK